MDKKLWILHESREFFCKKGIAGSSVRALARHLDMSDGNLRYHYKSKEKLIIEQLNQLIVEIQEVFSRQVNYYDISIEDLNFVFRDLYRVMHKYRFLYQESFSFSQELKKLIPLLEHEKFVRKSFYTTTVHRLRELGILSDNYTDKQYDTLCEHLVLISDGWLNQRSFKVNIEFENIIEDAVKLTLSLFVPYLY